MRSELNSLWPFCEKVIDSWKRKSSECCVLNRTWCFDRQENSVSPVSCLSSLLLTALRHRYLFVCFHRVWHVTWWLERRGPSWIQRAEQQVMCPVLLRCAASTRLVSQHNAHKHLCLAAFNIYQDVQHWCLLIYFSHMNQSCSLVRFCSHLDGIMFCVWLTGQLSVCLSRWGGCYWWNSNDPRSLQRLGLDQSTAGFVTHTKHTQ